MKNHKTEIKDIFFRSHNIGMLMTESRGTTLTDKQSEQLKAWEDKIRAGGKITAKQTETMLDYQNRRDTPPELSQTAKTFVDDTWLWLEKGFKRRIKSDYLDKGIYQESESFKLLTELEGIYFHKNAERFYKNHRTGECDHKVKQGDTVFIDDIKSSWDAKTFMNSDWDKIKEWQGHSYLDGYGGDVFRLRFVLVDAPDHIVMKQKERLWREFYDDSMTPEQQAEFEKLIEPMNEQIDRNLVYSNNPAYNKEERVKTYTMERDDDKIRQLNERVEMALEYYQTITLNRLVGKYEI